MKRAPAGKRPAAPAPRPKGSGPNAEHITPGLLERMRRKARRMAARSANAADEADLFDAGLLGVARAVRHWSQSGSGGDFEAYALASGGNAMRQELRERDPIARGRRGMIRAADAVEHRLVGTLGRPPRGSEVSRDLGLSFEAYGALVQAGSVKIVALEGSGVEAATASASSARPPSDACVDLLRRITRLREELGNIPPGLADVVRLYYEDGMTQREIGATLGVTESRVCQMLREAVDQLRERMVGPLAGGGVTLLPRRPSGE